MIPVHMQFQAEPQRKKQRKFHPPVAKKPLKPAHAFNPASLRSLAASFNIYHDYSQTVFTELQRGLAQLTPVSLHTHSTDQVIMPTSVTGNRDPTPDI